jgi:hypothetical protein
MRHCHKTIIVILYIAKGDDFLGRILTCFLLGTLIVGKIESFDMQTTLTVSNRQELIQAISQAKPNTKIVLASGEYQGGLHFSNLQGEPDKPIIIAGENANQKPIIKGEGNCLQFSDCAYLELHNLILTGASANGINIDDGGSFDTPSHHIVLKGLVVRDIGPEGNRDGIKLSGVDDFLVKDCTVERWGSGGSAIDMVGCHRGIIEACVFRHGDNIGDNAVQTKGGSKDIIIRRCLFEHAGSRAINVGGSTGLQFFRPKPQGYEAKDIIIEGCTFIGSQAPIAFVGVDGAIARFNTIYRPKKWILRILQETREAGFVPSRNGQFINNIIAFRSDEVATTVNIGSATAPETFKFAHNFWYCLDNSGNSKPDIPVLESEGIYGKDPMFQNAEKGDFRLQSESPAKGLGSYGLNDTK